MKILYLVLFICSMPKEIFCQEHGCTLAYVIGGVTNLILLIIIICLSVALYMTKNNLSLQEMSFKKGPAYTRQESGIGVTLRNVTSTVDVNEQSKHNGSTLTVNSGIVEIGSTSEPATPIREENKILYKKPIGIMPLVKKEQMDKIIGDVLSRGQKSDSATFREIDALAKQCPRKFESYKNSASLNDLDDFTSEVDDESFYGNALTINMMKNQNKELNETRKKPPTSPPKIKIPKHQHASNASVRVDTDDDEQEVYDKVPNPVRCTNPRNSDGSYVETLQLYDQPPARSWVPSNNQRVVLDHDTQYLLHLSNNREIDVDEEKATYINARVKI